MVAAGIISYVHFSPHYQEVGDTKLDTVLKHVIGDCRNDKNNRASKSKVKMIKVEADSSQL